MFNFKPVINNKISVEPIINIETEKTQNVINEERNSINSSLRRNITGESIQEKNSIIKQSPTIMYLMIGEEVLGKFIDKRVPVSVAKATKLGII